MSPRTRAAALLVTVVLPALVCGCAGDAEGDPAARLPDAVQLDPPAGAARLTAQEVERVVASARADRTTAAALRQGRVDRVLVRAGSPADRAATVAFLFDTPAAPGEDPYDVLCDIAGQTPEWRGVAARVGSDGDEVESSPVWLTGANCVGMPLPGSA